MRLSLIMNLRLTQKAKKAGQSVRDMITCQKQKSKIKPSINFTPALIAQQNVRQKSMVHERVIFLTAKNFGTCSHLSLATFPISH